MKHFLALAIVVSCGYGYGYGYNYTSPYFIEGYDFSYPVCVKHTNKKPPRGTRLPPRTGV